MNHKLIIVLYMRQLGLLFGNLIDNNKISFNRNILLNINNLFNFNFNSLCTKILILNLYYNIVVKI